MAAVVPCPRCKNPLTIPNPVPDSLRCEKCGASSKINSSRQAPAEPAPSPVGTPYRQSKAGMVVSAAAMLLLLAGFGAWGFFALEGRKEAPTPVVQEPDLPPPPEEIQLDFGIKNKAKEPAPRKLDPRVKDSVTKGLAYLRTQVGVTAKGAHHQGAIPLMGLTLLACGVPAEDPDVVRIAGLVRGMAPQMTQTYSAAPSILFLDRLSEGKPMPEGDRKLIRTLAMRLIAGRHQPYGMWSYNLPILNGPAEEKVFSDMKTNQPAPPDKGRRTDLSNTQFAALALWTARKHEIPVEPALRAAAVAARQNQDAKGTLGYYVQTGPNRDTGTCVGLILLALGRAVEDDTEVKDKGDFRKDPAAVKALGHLEQMIKGEIGPPKLKKIAKLPAARARRQFDAHGDLYFLWTLERTALILGLDKIGEHDWHKWGTEIVLKMQDEKTGMWSEQNGGVPDTCFALLFLMRANLFQDLTDKLKVAMLPGPGDGLAMSGLPGTRP